MTAKTSLESLTLREEVRRLEAEGYDVLLQPRPPRTPEFLGDYLPDAIAIGKDKKLVIEIRRGSRFADEGLKELSARFAKQNEWELRVIYVVAHASPPTLAVENAEQIESTILEIRQLKDNGAIRSAFLLAWAVLEAEARRLLGDLVGRPQSPGRVVQVLGEAGLLTPDTTDNIRRLAEKRNRLIHGELSADISPDYVDRLLAALSELRSQQPQVTR
jgi:uncharacterized protein YutE (UPF0331/DUF86 family)